RQRITELEQQLSETERDAKRSEAAATLAASRRYGDVLARGLYALQQEMIAHFSVLVAANRRGDLEGAIDRMVDAIFYPDSAGDGDETVDDQMPAETGEQPTKSNHEEEKPE